MALVDMEEELCLAFEQDFLVSLWLICEPTLLHGHTLIFWF
jgi:hypothetical protein